jgi:transcriptional regulator with XRE-family HTH domain
MSDSSQLGICQRIAKIRSEVAGPRGKSSFAKKLGISASTYDYYESRRVPPADILVRIADVGGVDLRWLLTGDGPGGSAGEATGGPIVPAAHPVLQRAAILLARRPDSAGPLGAFLEILAESLKFPAKSGRASNSLHAENARGDSCVHQEVARPASEEACVQQVARPTPTPASVSASAPAPAPAEPVAQRDAWIPILGRSAAGVPQFWSGAQEASGVRTLGELVERQVRRGPARFEPAAASGLAFDPQAEDARGPLRDLSVQIVTLEGPDDNDVAEYVASKEMKARYGDAFAVRIDGESMSPEIRHGDLVVLSPSVPAAQGRPAVVQLHQQIGVTCKLYRREAQAVHLVPVNEQFATQTFSADRVAWALRVLATIRPLRP